MEIALIASLAVAGYSAYSAYETKQVQEAAIEKQEVLAQKDVQEKKNKIIAQQRASFLASGISLTSESVNVFNKETNEASQAETNRISNYYDTYINQIGGAARTQYINSLSSAINATGNYFNAGA